MTRSTRTTEPLQTLDKIGLHQLKPELVQGMPVEFLKSQHVIPILLPDGRVAIACADPANMEAYDAIVTRLSALAAGDDSLERADRGWVLKGPCPLVVCPAEEIENAISHCYYTQADLEVEDLVAGTPETAAQAGDPTRPEDLMDIGDQAPAI
jgi:hypothetical protein